jgi:hypothetical protein
MVCLDPANSRSYSGSGSTWTDLCGSGHNGAISNATFVPHTTATGPAHFDFDGTGDKVMIDHHTDFQFAGDFTICMWAYLDVAMNGNLCVLISNRDTSDWNASFQIWFEDRGGQNAFLGTVPEEGSAAAQPSGVFDGTFNKWDFVAMRMSGTTCSMIINDASAVDDSLSSRESTQDDGNVRIGGGYSGPSVDNYMLNGKIGSVHIYNKALTDTQIQQNYKAQKGRYNR